AKGAERGRWPPVDPERLQPAADLADLAACGLVIEAAPESLALKRELFAALSEVVGESCVLATNTSSIPVTAIAGAARRPERVVGMHFFNPPALMRLLEVIAGDASSKDALAVARAVGEAMGKDVILASDGPGFLVNRCGRPFLLEAQRLVTERVATVEQVDRICRLAGGFRMGPFELSDLVGVDVGFEVAKSFYELSFGEPRWRPSPLAARMVAAGRWGRKSGRGYYEYGDDAERPADPVPPDPGGGDGLVVVAGETPLTAELRMLAATAGWDVRSPAEADGEVPALILDCGADPEDAPLQGGPQAILLAEGSLGDLDPEGTAVGFHVLPPLGRLVELTRAETSSPAAVAAAERFFATLGMQAEWVGDAPGLVLGRIVGQLVNEAAFALGEGVGSAEDIDTGMVLGLNHPRGPLAWGDLVGLDQVLTTLDALNDFYREERYRAAPLLRRHVAAGRLGQHVGQGFR
ncbi:MAG: 3-hydroxybutyryl-CoA dehydrogenase, partial [Solirubrobacterales bacterium]|nr:3-hydroxybutyryl-CoA dehydrogenase [Solirubrobacterales bacterium]